MLDDDVLGVEISSFMRALSLVLRMQGLRRLQPRLRQYGAYSQSTQLDVAPHGLILRANRARMQILFRKTYENMHSDFQVGRHW
jgi:hypothetical protein